MGTATIFRLLAMVTVLAGFGGLGKSQWTCLRLRPREPEDPRIAFMQRIERRWESGRAQRGRYVQV